MSLPTIQFIGGLNGGVIQDLNGSGLGFFGTAGFGAAVQVAFWQDHTFVTDGNGVSQGWEVPNVKYLNAQSGILGQQSSGIPLIAIPNYQSTLNIRFLNGSPVKTQNVKLRIYDRVNIDNPASGVTTAVYECIHPNVVQANTGSGALLWSFPGGSGSVLTLSPSPGISGQYAGNGSNSVWTDTEHDWYVALSASPTSIGSKTLYGLYVSLEYL